MKTWPVLNIMFTLILFTNINTRNAIALTYRIPRPIPMSTLRFVSWPVVD